MERRTFRDHLCNWLGFTFLWRLQVLHRREEGQERREGWRGITLDFRQSWTHP
ncbi:hypothetical protein CUMW_142220 [Citrus unshiu]|nr:hypothetical protein CUMW_142220 [Citrus unshiu]